MFLQIYSFTNNLNDLFKGFIQQVYLSNLSDIQIAQLNPSAQNFPVATKLIASK
jgi:hypothetical protein